MQGADFMKCINLIDAFDTEIEVLEINDESMIYAQDRKNEMMDVCHIGRYDFGSGEKQQLAVLDYTRLYESFQTYSQSEEYFYAMNVLQDYRLRLRRISKKTWSPEGELVIEALGEILSIFILNEQYLLIVDEVKKTDEFLEMYRMKDDGSAYMNLCYLYDCYSKKRYPVTDQRLHGLTETVKVCEGMYPQLVIGVGGTLYTADLGAFIRSVTEKMPLFLKEIYTPDDRSTVHFFENDNHDIAFRVRMTDADGHCTQEILARYDTETEETEVMRQYPVREDGTYFYDSWNYHVYYEADYDMTVMAHADADHENADHENADHENADHENADHENAARPLKHITCVTDDSRSFDYDSRFGEFSGIYRDDLFLTTFYKEVMMKEYEFHEYVAVHHNGEKAAPYTAEGRFAVWKDRVILLRTFLAL